MKRPNLTKDEIRQACDLYLSGQTANKIASNLGIARQNVLRYLHKEGIAVRSNSISHRHLACDHHYFDLITTPTPAYWLGFLAADGGISRGSLQLILSSKDIDHVKAFARDIKSEHTIWNKNYDGYARCGISIGSPEFLSALAKYDIVPNKGPILKWPNLPDGLHRHFLRGYIDGNGCFCINKRENKRVSLYFSFVSNLSFVTNAQQFLVENCDLNYTKLHKHKSPHCYSVQYAGVQDVFRIVKFLYHDAERYLPRKKEIVVKYLASRDDYAQHVAELS